MNQCPRKRLLREILRARLVPDLAVQEAHERGIGAAIHVCDVVGHSWPQPRNWHTSRSSSPGDQLVLPPSPILMLARRPATSTAGSSVATSCKSGSALSSAK